MKWSKKVQTRAKRMYTNPELERGDESGVIRKSLNGLPRAASGSHILDGLSDTGNLRRTSSAMPPKNSEVDAEKEAPSAAKVQPTVGTGGGLFRKLKMRVKGGAGEERTGMGLGARLKKLGGKKKITRLRSRNSMAMDQELATAREKDRKLEAAEIAEKAKKEAEAAEKRVWNERYENMKESKKNYVDQVENEIRRMEGEIDDRMALPEDWQVLPRTHDGRKVRMPGSDQATTIAKLPAEEAVRQDREDRPGFPARVASKKRAGSKKSLFDSAGGNESPNGNVSI